MKNVYYITGNPHKLETLKRYLDYPIEHKAIDLPEIQSLDLHEVTLQKAKDAYQIVQAPVLVEDTSLHFTALNGLPGPFVRWFLDTIHNDGLCRILDAYNDRSAVGSVSFCFYDGQRSTFFDSERKGMIAEKPRGTNGFGWDPIFIPEGRTKTWGEMTLDEQKETSIRRESLVRLNKFLELSVV